MHISREEFETGTLYIFSYGSNYRNPIIRISVVTRKFVFTELTRVTLPGEIKSAAASLVREQE